MRAGEFWKTYLAVAVLAGLGAYLYFVESKREEKPEKPKEKVFALDKAKVKELTLAPSGGEAIRLVKEGSNWTMAAPKALPADGPAADSLVSTLESLEVDEVAAPSAPHLADFGLESPKLTVGVLLQGATEPLKLLLGEKLADGSGIYAKLPTQPRVFTIPSYVESSLNKKPFDLRDRDLLHVKRDAVKTLEISDPGGSYALARDDKGEWAFTKPLATRAGRWSVDSLLGTIENLRMESVAAEEATDLKPFGLAKAARTVTLGLSDGTTRTLEIGAASEADKVSKDKDKKSKKEASKDKPTKYYARDATRRLVAVIPAALEDDLAKGMKELRAKRLLEVATYEVEGIEAQLGAQKRVYTKAAQKDPKGPETPKWKRTAPEAKDLESTKVEDALFKLGGLEVQEFIDAPKDAPAYGLDAPAFRLALRFGAAKPEASVELGKKDGAVYARRTGDSSLLKLDPAKAEELIKAFQEL
jgi:hypothetical protein